MKDNSKFIQKQDRLNAALEKVKNHLQYLLEKYSGKLLSQYEGDEAKEIEKWNDWHDLQYRIEERLRENYVQYQHWHFKEFEWCAF